MPQLFHLWPIDQSQNKENYNVQRALTNESPRWSTNSVAEQYFDLQSTQYTKYF